jgi:GH24 family phage-related lysozyme (muramidase)
MIVARFDIPSRLAVALALSAMLGAASPVRSQDAASAKALDVASLLREVESATRLARGLKLNATPNVLREGDALVLDVDLPHAGWLNVISINSAGEPIVLFPNQVQSDNKVEAGRFSFPTPAMGFEVRAAAPHGESRIAAFLSSEPLNLYLNGDGERNNAGALLDRFARLSSAGRDLINLFTTRKMQDPAGVAPPLVAGMTVVLSCAKTGPCEPSAGPPSGIRRIVDAIVPGIFLDKDADLAEAKDAALRPLHPRGLELTKASEGFVPRLYHDSAGLCTIAYGHLLRLKPCSNSERRLYPKGISEPAGAELLARDLDVAQRMVSAMVKVDLSDAQYASLVDFTFNVGAGNFKRSTLLKAVNARQHERVPFQLRRWTRAGGRELRGLVIRREREIALYFEGTTTPKTLPQGENVTPLDIRTGESPP